MRLGGAEMEDDLLDAACEVVRERLRRWSKDGSDAGEKVNSLRLLPVDLQRDRAGNLEPMCLPQPVKDGFEPFRLLLGRVFASEKSPSLKKPIS